jgi:hypothetical protein
MNFLIKTFGEPEAHIHFPECVRHSNGPVGAPTIERNVDMSTIALKAATLV